MKFLQRIIALAGAVSLVLSASMPASACTRMVYHGLDGLVITGRSMDWRDKIPADMWIFPRGMKHEGGAGPGSVTWTSKYGSVLVTSFGIAATDGMNEKGLVANLLWLAGSRYPEPHNLHNGLSIAAWAQYFLDNFASVDQAVKSMKKDPLQVVSDVIPGTDRFTTLHLSISDASGDSAIFEYIDGKLVIHHGRQYQVMTNEPEYSKQLAREQYWEQIGGTSFLPGTNRSSDRFARAAFYIHAITKTANSAIGVAAVMSVVNNVSVPMGISTPGQPNISNTRWRVVADQKDLRYYYESVRTPNTFWVDLRKANLKVGAPVLLLPLANDEIYSGDALKDFKPSKPFKFMTLEASSAL